MGGRSILTGRTLETIWNASCGVVRSSLKGDKKWQALSGPVVWAATVGEGAARGHDIVRRRTGAAAPSEGVLVFAFTQERA